jgi:hypothetical protein
VEAITTKRQVDKRWSEVRTVLATQGPAQVLAVVRDLYELGGENRDFLNARCLAAANRLEPYKRTIGAAIYPDVYRGKTVRVSAARKAISQYTKATEDHAGTLELMVYFVERGNQFTVNFGDIDEGFYSSLSSMFGCILEMLKRSDAESVESLVPRLIAIRDAANGIGWGYHDYLREALSRAFPNTTEE